MAKAIHHIPVRMPRNAFTPRDRGRAGDVWRAFQDVAVEASTAAGWPPSRYREEGSAFVVRDMTVVHEREARYGVSLQGETWLHSFKRGILVTREIRLSDDEGPIAATEQLWAHVGEGLAPTRAPASLTDAFPPHEGDSIAKLPKGEAVEGPVHTFEFTPWHVWMDPLGHVNHPAYVDWCEEAIARVVAAKQHDPANVVPLAERLSFRRGVLAAQPVTLTTQLVARLEDGGAITKHEINTTDGVCVKAKLHRRLDDGDLAELLSE